MSSDSALVRITTPDEELILVSGRLVSRTSEGKLVKRCDRDDTLAVADMLRDMKKEGSPQAVRTMGEIAVKVSDFNAPGSLAAIIFTTQTRQAIHIMTLGMLDVITAAIERYDDQGEKNSTAEPGHDSARVEDTR